MTKLPAKQEAIEGEYIEAGSNTDNRFNQEQFCASREAQMTAAQQLGVLPGQGQFVGAGAGILASILGGLW